MRDVDIPVGLLPPEIQEAARAAAKRTGATKAEAEAVLQEQIVFALKMHFGVETEDCEEVLSRRILKKRKIANEAAERDLDKERRPKLKAAV